MAISQAIIIQKELVLMVKQKTKRGTEIWNFPGGNIEECEAPEEACIREVLEETGYTVQIERLLHKKKEKKWSYLCYVVGGALGLDKENPENEDLLDVRWIPLKEKGYFDSVTAPLLELAQK